MDENFAYFLSRLGPALGRRDVEPAYAATYRGRLPGKLIEYWLEHGFSGYGKGRFWTVDPGEYRGVLDLWLEHSPLRGRDNYHVIARTAFGGLRVWGTNSGSCLLIDAAHGLLFPNPRAADSVRDWGEDVALQAFFVSLSPENMDFSDNKAVPMFKRALARLGQLGADEMYGFEPMLGLGGEPVIENLRKVDALTHLEILAQLGVPRVLENPLLKPD